MIRRKRGGDNLGQKLGKATMVVGLGTAAVGGGMYASGLGKYKTGAGELFGKENVKTSEIIKDSFKGGSKNVSSWGDTFKKTGESLKEIDPNNKVIQAKAGSWNKMGVGAKRMGAGMRVGKVGGIIGAAGLATWGLSSLFGGKKKDD